jgi:uncharacterized membrane protein YraQ (UPF0718 family)
MPVMPWMLATFLHTAGSYLREIVEILLLGFTIAGVINAVVNKDAVMVEIRCMTPLLTPL